MSQTQSDQPSASKEKASAGVLLVHGLNGSQSDLSEVEQALKELGIVTHNMLLPGHGLHVRDLMPLGWEDWEQAVLAELSDLKERCTKVFLIGHSLGGALVLHAAANEQVDGIITMCAPVHLFPWMKPAVRLVGRVFPLLPTIREDVKDRAARRHYSRGVYRWTPMSPVESLIRFLPHLRAELPRVTAPALIMISLHDHVVPARDGRQIYRLIGSHEKHLVTFHRSYHVIMKDHDREEVLEKTIAFIRRHANLGAPLSSRPLADDNDRRD